MSQRVIVTGGRNYRDRFTVNAMLDAIHAEDPIEALIHGDAEGADRLAHEWAVDRGVERIVCPARWNVYGAAAGPIRNKQMLLNVPSLVVAFPGGKGTADMVRQAERAGVPVRRP